MGGVFTYIARIFEIVSHVIGANTVSAKASIGEGTVFFHHGLGCVVHRNATIGEKCKIFCNVTLGDKWGNGKCEDSAPTIGNRVLIGAGSVILGNISIGNDVVIGANSVVLNDIPDGCTVAGVPATIIKCKN